MTRKQKELHKQWCDLMVARVPKPEPIVCVRTPRQKSPKGIVFSGDSKAMLARKLAAMI